MIDVSIVLTVYNAESYIEGCLDMITGQTLRNIQIICVDDGSTDNSSQIIEQYAQKDDRIVLIREKNAGTVECRRQQENIYCFSTATISTSLRWYRRLSAEPRRSRRR